MNGYNYVEDSSLTIDDSYYTHRVNIGKTILLFNGSTSISVTLLASYLIIKHTPKETGIYKWHLLNIVVGDLIILVNSLFVLLCCFSGKF